MTPGWISDNADIIGPHSLKPDHFEILPTTGANEQCSLQIQLVAPGVLTSTYSVVVKLTIAMDVLLANVADHDPLFGISDGTSFVGFRAFDRVNYGELPPCQPTEGDSINGTLQNETATDGPKVSRRSSYSSEIKMQFRPNEQWGSCHTEQTSAGYTIIGNYQRDVDYSKGLFLRMYRNNPSEKYYIKYIVVEVDLE